MQEMERTKRLPLAAGCGCLRHHEVCGEAFTPCDFPTQEYGRISSVYEYIVHTSYFILTKGGSKLHVRVLPRKTKNCSARLSSKCLQAMTPKSQSPIPDFPKRMDTNKDRDVTAKTKDAHL